MASITIEFVGSIKKIAGMERLILEIPEKDCKDGTLIYRAIKNVLGEKILFNVYRNGKVLTPDPFVMSDDDIFQIVPVTLGG